MKPNELMKALRDGSLAPIYLLYGEDRASLEEAVRTITALAVEGGAADFNVERFRGKEVDPGHLGQALRTIPMMAPRRFVVVRDVHEASAAVWEELGGYAAAPSPTTVALLVGDKADARTSSFKAIAKVGCAVRFEVPYERQLVPWCRDRARAMGARIDEDAARLLVEVVGRDPSGLQAALERLHLFVGDKGVIDSAAVEEVVAETRTHSVFALCDAVGAADVARAWTLSRKLFAQREAPLKLLAMVARHFRLLLRLRAERDAGSSRDAAGAALKMSPFALRNLWPQTERHTQEGLSRRLMLIFDADVEIKSSRLSPEIIFDRLLVDLCRRSSRRSPSA